MDAALPACPSDEALAAALDTAADAAARAALLAHADGCEACAALVAATMEVAVPAVAATVGHFVLERHLGSGAMGDVFAAYDPRLQRRVALKLRRDAPATQSGALAGYALSQTEAAAMAQLAHPHVVTVHEVGVTAAHAFVVMELVAGETLGAWCAAQRPLMATRVRIALEVGEALSAAHRLGLLHRDIKPSNILVAQQATASGARWHSKLGDFGLACEAGSDAAARVAGTRGYLAPELAAGAIATEASDQYAYALVVAELLSGALLSWPVLASRNRGAEAEPRNAYARRVGAAVPPPFRRVLQRALAQDPSQRFSDVGALVAALQRVAQQRRRLQWGAGVTLLVLATLLPALMMLRRAGAPTTTAVCRQATMGLDTAWTPRVAAQLHGVLARHAPARALATRNRMQAFAQQWRTAQLATCTAAHAGTLPPAVALARNQCLTSQLQTFTSLLAIVREAAVHEGGPLGEVALRLAEPSDCNELTDANATHAAPGQLWQAGLTQARAWLAAGVPVQARAALALVGAALPSKVTWREHGQWAYLDGEIALQQGAFAHAAAAYQRAMDAGARNGDDLIVAKAWLARAFTIVHKMGRLSEADHHLESARLAVLRAGQPPSLRAAHESLLGNVAFARDRYDEAHQHFLRAYESVQRPEDGAPVGVAPLAALSYLNNLGVAALRAGDTAGAIAAAERVVATRRFYLGAQHPDVATALMNLGAAYMAQGAYHRALAAENEALATRQQVLPATHAAIVESRLAVGAVQAALGDSAGALAHYQAALAIAESTLDARHPTVAMAQNNAGVAALRLEHVADAERWLHQALATRVALYGENHTAVARTWQALGGVALAKKQWSLAAAYFGRALRAKAAHHVPQGDTAYAHWGVALAAQGRGQRAAARRAYAAAWADAAALDPQDLLRWQIALSYGANLHVRGEEGVLRTSLVTNGCAGLQALVTVGHADATAWSRKAPAHALCASVKAAPL